MKSTYPELCPAFFSKLIGSLPYASPDEVEGLDIVRAVSAPAVPGGAIIPSSAVINNPTPSNVNGRLILVSCFCFLSSCGFRLLQLKARAADGRAAELELRPAGSSPFLVDSRVPGC
jgi:hypothetical protein